LGRVRSRLAARLRARSAEIEETIFNRLRLMSTGEIDDESEYSGASRPETVIASPSARQRSTMSATSSARRSA
jgi:hypothetical protein